MKPRFLIRAKAANLQVEIWINDIPVSFLRWGEDASPTAIPVNQFLLNGRNTVSVVLNAGPLPSRASLSWTNDSRADGYSGEASFSLSIGRERLDQPTTLRPATPLAVIDWEGKVAPKPIRLEREFLLDEQMGPWAWESAERFSGISPGLRTDICDYISRLHALLSARRFDGFLAESALKLNELTELAYGVSADSMRRGMIQALESHSGEPYKLRPLDVSEIDMRLISDGRMVECQRTDRGYILEYVEANGENSLFLPIMVGKIKSQWRILR